ncbi:ATP-binding protein [Paenibacillus sp. YPG26]|uniref:ATP-binding protein n=1 Tax=Paenibacillus sp. YPG26 TaxID=2878915 RepID=UPI0020416D9C|nr:ATP-binding protein [Paenibacillus sp. YPG26]USB33350.1 PAS domain S-box protein [Paenibacillus sp. YPG26]
MSIKTKLSIIISFLAVVLLSLNIILSYFTTQENLRKDSENKIMLTAKQIAIAVEQSGFSSEYVERQMTEKLRMASLLAAKELNPDIRKVTNEQLAQLAKKAGVTGISLFVKTDNDIVVSKSSESKEIGLSTNKWGYWYAAFHQLFNLEPVTVQAGQASEHFWSGPFDYSASFPGSLVKWGYYYDGTRDYIIDPYIRKTEMDNFFEVLDPERIIAKTRDANTSVLDITGINLSRFEEAVTQGLPLQNDISVEMKDRPLTFGKYNYPSPEADLQVLKEAIRNGQSAQYDVKIGGKRVIKSFIPIKENSNYTYVIRIISSYDPIYSVLSKQMISQISISLVLLEVVIFASYILAGLLIRPIQDILLKVNGMADGNFETQLEVSRKDELGLLAARINAMGGNLAQYTRDLREMIDENRSVKEHLESIIRQTADAIHLTDPEGKIIRVNKAFEQLYGWTSEEIQGVCLFNTPESLREEESLWKKKLSEGIPIFSAETVRLTKAGAEVRVSVSESPIFDEDGRITAYVIISRDMTERNKMEELLRRSEKLTTVGQLAAGVAHEIRNPLTTLKGFLQLQLQTKKLNTQHTDLMLSELDRINLIVSEFLILAKPQAVHFQVKDIRYILGDVISLLDSQAHLHSIEFSTDFSAEALLVHCEENQLKQVFINLLKNAMEAMPNGGIIHMQTWRKEPDRVMIRIRDEGVGISKATLAKLGEPFFTNKETGTGLGLMVSQRIIETHRGIMEIESELDKGTTVTVALPVGGSQGNMEDKIQPDE